MVRPSAITRFVPDRPETGAVFSADRRYRYALWRRWNPNAGRCNVVMLNPSKANETHDDATIASCRRRAERWGFGGLVVTNLFALCATNPVDLLAAVEPVGPANDAAIIAAARAAALVICAWGHHGAHLGRSRVIRELLEGLGVKPFCLHVTALGEPGHPLYLRYDLSAVPWEPR